MWLVVFNVSLWAALKNYISEPKLLTVWFLILQGGYGNVKCRPVGQVFGPPIGSRWKHLNHYLMDCCDIYSRNRNPVKYGDLLNCRATLGLAYNKFGTYMYIQGSQRMKYNDAILDFWVNSCKNNFCRLQLYFVLISKCSVAVYCLCSLNVFFQYCEQRQKVLKIFSQN